MAVDEKALIAKKTNATAPYNFIPLNSKVLQPDVSKEFIDAIPGAEEDKTFYAKEMCKKKLYSGYFDLTIINKTPLFIGMGAKDGQFFNDGINPCIPGSSLRGCIKNLYKIITFSSFRAANLKEKGFESADANDEKMYYRAIGAPGSARISDAYKKAIPSKPRKLSGETELYPSSAVHSGFLVKIDGEYFVCACKCEAVALGKDKAAAYGNISWQDDEVFVKIDTNNIYYRLYDPDFSRKLNVEKKPKSNAVTSIQIINEAYQKDASRTDISIINTAESSNGGINYERQCLRNGYGIEGGFGIAKNLPEASYVVPCFYVNDATGTRVKNIGAGPYLTKKLYEPQYYTKAGFIVKKGRDYYLAKASMKVHKFKEDEKKISGTIIWEDMRVLVYTGEIAGKSHYYAITAPNFNRDLIPLTDNGKDKLALELYKNDVNRNGLWLVNSDVSDKTKDVERENLAKGFAMSGSSGQAMLANTKNIDYAIPCFYLEEANGIAIKYISANPLPRVAYNNTLKQHIPAQLQSAQLDFADMVFGHTNLWSSRLGFENMYLAQGSSEEYEYNKNDNYIKPLLGAKPTAGQFYLDEYEHNVASTWDDMIDKSENNVNIRGYKMYWHRKPDYMFDPSESKDANKINYDVLAKMIPLKAGRKFTGRIHFSGIDDKELGALAFLFRMCEDENCCLKLGGGAPLGLGSVKLKANLFVDDDDFYSSLFEGEGFKVPGKKSLEEFANVFESYVKQQPGIGEEFDQRIESLRTILDASYMNRGDWNRRTRYMQVDGKENLDGLPDSDIYSYRCVLPKIEDVIKKL